MELLPIGGANCRCCYFQTPSVVHCLNATASAQSPIFLRKVYPQTIFANFCLPDITGRTAKAVRPDAVNAKYHVITNATYNRDPVPAKFKHVTNIDTCTLLCCDYNTLWEAMHVNMVEIGARCSDKNVKILGRYQW